MKIVQLSRSDTPTNINRKPQFYIPVILVLIAVFSGCENKDIDNDFVVDYQQALVKQGPQRRVSEKGVESLQPVPPATPKLPKLDIQINPDEELPIINLSLEEALVRTLANSPDIKIVSYDPSISAEEITKAMADFDPVAFGRLDYQDNDNPTNSTNTFTGRSSDIGQQETRLWETGIKQRNQIGSEWSLSYALVRNRDDLYTRTLSTRYEPVMLFQVRQPLWRDAWSQFNMAGINISKLSYKISLASFRQKTEEIATQVITAYWILVQAKKDIEIQQDLLDKTVDTLQKMKDRKGIDATTLHVSQVESALKTREGTLLESQKTFTDVQDALVRFISDEQLNLSGNFKVSPTSSPILKTNPPDSSDVLREAMAYNPHIQQAHLGIEIAEINVQAARNQKMPRLDLVATARMNGLERGYGSANETMREGDYTSYSIGITYEFPLGNRMRKAELRKRKLERSKATSILRNISDQVAMQAKERLRELKKTQSEMQVHTQAIEAAKTHLQALEDTESVRRNLTPEFLLVKLQAQESVAIAQRAHIRAVVDFNNAIVQLEQSKGTVLQMLQVNKSLLAATP